jgi:hypothetical protein
VVSGIQIRRQGASGTDPSAPLRQALPKGRVTLVKPPLRVPTTAYGTLRCPPIGLAYIAAVLEERGFAVSIVDGVGENPQQIQTTADPHFVRVGLGDAQIVERIPRDTTVLGVSCMFSEEWPFTRAVIGAPRRAFPGVPIVAGGHHTVLDRNVGDILNRWTTVVPGLGSRGKAPVPVGPAPQSSAADLMTN